jgi:import receptor subunit TOM22
MVRLQEIEKPQKIKAEALAAEDDVDNLVLDDDIENETLYDRLVALQDMIPAETRAQMLKSASVGVQSLWTGARVLGNVAWILSTSAMILILPLMVCEDQEHAMMMQHEEQQRMQKGAAQVSDLSIHRLVISQNSIINISSHYLIIYKLS